MAALKPDVRIAIALFVLVFVPYAYFYGGWGPNQEVNYALTRAMFEAHTFQIDKFTAREGDIADGVGGHMYINKPPGLSMLAFPPHYVQMKMQQHGWWTFHDYWRSNRQLLTIEICGVSGALIAPILFLYGRRRMAVSRRSAAIVAISIAFGTIVLPYSTIFFAHVPSALFLLLALVLLDDHPFAAGAAAAIAGACFFLCALAALLLVPLAWSYGRKNAALFVAGGVPFAAALAAYQWICFGSPFTTPVQRSVSFTDQRLFLGVFGVPRLDVLRAITFSEYRGLFYCSPVLLFAFGGAMLMVRQRRLRAEVVALGAITVFFLLAVSSFNGWHGGAAFGPRYLMPIVPLLGVPMMLVAGRVRWLWLLTGVVAASINIAATAVDPIPEPEVTHPITGFIFPVLLTQRIPLDARTILYPDCKTARCTPKVSLTPDSRNFGEPLFGQGRASSLLPVLVWIIAGSALVLAAAKRADRRFRAAQPASEVPPP